jgi:hypothetical protein
MKSTKNKRILWGPNGNGMGVGTGCEKISGMGMGWECEGGNGMGMCSKFYVNL